MKNEEKKPKESYRSSYAVIYHYRLVRASAVLFCAWIRDSWTCTDDNKKKSVEGGLQYSGAWLILSACNGSLYPV